MIVCNNYIVKTRFNEKARVSFRIIIGVVLPPLLGMILLLVYWRYWPIDREVLLFSLAFAYTGMGVQSLIYSLIMEFVVNRLFLKSYEVLIVSAIMGCVSGLVLAINLRELELLMAGTGVIVGLLIGFLLRYLHSRQPIAG